MPGAIDRRQETLANMNRVPGLLTNPNMYTNEVSVEMM